MSKPKNHVPLLGSERAPLPGARVAGRLDPNERITVTVVLHPRLSRQDSSIESEFGARPPRSRRYLTREELGAAYGASREDLKKVEEFAQEYALDVVEESPAKRSVVLSGSIAQFSRAFNVKLVRYRHPNGIHRGHSGPIYLPAGVATVVQAVLGLDNRPQAKSHVRLKKRAAAGGVTYSPPQVAQLYDFPSGPDGAGQSVAIVEFGGGFAPRDLQAYFSGLGIPIPGVLSISVDGAGNSPTGDANGPDAEVMLDIEVVGSIAPKARIYVYFAPNTDAGFVDAVSSAVHDSQRKPSVVSISWGDAEVKWTKQAIQALSAVFQDAAMLGVTICAASGDGGSSDGVGGGLAHVDFPASSPYVLGCGGTRLESDGETITSEVAWNDQPSGGASGGGVSDVFPPPHWQGGAKVPPSVNPGGRVGRGVPDVSGNADPLTGYLVRVDGKQFTIGGTSAVAPLWAGLIALANQRLGKPAGYLNPLLYGLPASADDLRDIRSGNNGAYSAGPGWDACTGLGSPDGTKLAALL
jgi:kumamolisin